MPVHLAGLPVALRLPLDPLPPGAPGTGGAPGPGQALLLRRQAQDGGTAQGLRFAGGHGAAGALPAGAALSNTGKKSIRMKKWTLP